MNANRSDNFLRLIRRSQRGRLKIYLGYAAGVGKTYQMLLEGHRIKEDGIDLTVGLVETHGRAETEALLMGLEVIPRRKVTYRGIEIEEMDLNAILARRPSIVLVDELAHTNLPGSRNTKRYQDVEELLAAGIHVISTLNIQHLESLYETIERATGVKVRERIPDRVITEADQLVNVDITIEDLRRRLKEGRVYTRDRIETALDHFFRPTNLEQLRELTLRELAAQIDSRRRDPQADDIPVSPDQVMVCLSSRGPNSEALLRYASRLAGRLNRNWYAVYVQTSKERPTLIDAATQRILANTLTLAQQLGATVFTYKGDDVVKTILQFAREYRVGHIVVGTPGKKVSFWKRLRGETSMVDRLVTEGRGITIVVPDTKAIRKELPSIAATTPDEAVTPNCFQRQKDLLPPILAVLCETTALVWEKPIEKEEAIQHLLDSCRGIDKTLKKSAWESVLERERKGGTFVGKDVTIPHARITGLSCTVISIGVCREGIQDRDSGQKIRIMLMLLSPVDPPGSHLEALALTSRMAGDDQWRRRMISARTSDDVLRTVHDWADRLFQNRSL
jgi:two-component system, OmpR family, sensor histidine kinase KdpD